MAHKKRQVRRPSKFKRFAEMVSSASEQQEIKRTVKARIQRGADNLIVRYANSGVGKATATILKPFSNFERWLAALLILFPIFLIVFNGWPMGSEKGSISAYHAMTNPNNLVAFYFPLTAAAMLFIVNGFVRRKPNDSWHSYYNVYLGIMLSGVILFNNNDFSTAHNIFAALFFGGNVLVILLKKTSFFQSDRAENIFDWTILGLMVLSLLLFFFRPFEFFNLFYLEWISLALISLHFILLSFGAERRSTLGKPARV